jgi:hypothetical protein
MRVLLQDYGRNKKMPLNNHQNGEEIRWGRGGGWRRPGREHEPERAAGERADGGGVGLEKLLPRTTPGRRPLAGAGMRRRRRGEAKSKRAEVARRKEKWRRC